MKNLDKLLHSYHSWIQQEISVRLELSRAVQFEGGKIKWAKI